MGIDKSVFKLPPPPTTEEQQLAVNRLERRLDHARYDILRRLQKLGNAPKSEHAILFKKEYKTAVRTIEIEIGSENLVRIIKEANAGFWALKALDHCKTFSHKQKMDLIRSFHWEGDEDFVMRKTNSPK